MPEIAYPNELKKSFWDKKKGALDGAAEVENLLKALEKKHEAVAWAQLAPGWAKGVADEARLKALYEGLDKLYRLKVAPLKLEAGSLMSAADKAAKAKDAAKPLKDACAAIAKAAAVYAKAVAAGLDELERDYEAARKAAPAPAPQEGQDDEPTSALIDPKRLLKQLQLCKADPDRQVNFAMVDDGKQDPVLVLHPRLSGRSMLARLVKDIGIKTGAFGLVSLEGTTLLLVVEKKVAGLVKRIRIPVRQCGFKVGRVKQLDDKGVALEEDLDEDADAPAAPHPTAAPGAPAAPAAPKATAASAETAAPAAKAALPAAMAAWSTAREAAIASLRDAAREIAALKDPDSSKALIELNAVIKNLTPEPRTPAQVAELVRYIDKDDVVLDVSDFASDIRTPLLKALAQLHRAVSA